MTARDIARRLAAIVEELESMGFEAIIRESGARANAAMKAARADTRKTKGGDRLKGKGKKPMKGNKGGKDCK